jgi:DNA-binding MarR family transcriptional regulator
MDAATDRSRSIARSLLKAREWSERHLHIQNSIIRWDVLLVLASAESQSLLYGELDSRVGRSPRALQYVLRELQSLGLVLMEKADHDRRCVRITLTEDARGRIEQLAELIDAMLPDQGAEARGRRAAMQPVHAY